MSKRHTKQLRLPSQRQAREHTGLCLAVREYVSVDRAMFAEYHELSTHNKPHSDRVNLGCFRTSCNTRSQTVKRRVEGWNVS